MNANEYAALCKAVQDKLRTKSAIARHGLSGCPDCKILVCMTCHTCKPYQLRLGLVHGE